MPDYFSSDIVTTEKRQAKEAKQFWSCVAEGKKPDVPLPSWKTTKRLFKSGEVDENFARRSGYYPSKMPITDVWKVAMPIVIGAVISTGLTSAGITRAVIPFLIPLFSNASNIAHPDFFSTFLIAGSASVAAMLIPLCYYASTDIAKRAAIRDCTRGVPPRFAPKKAERANAL